MIQILISIFNFSLRVNDMSIYCEFEGISGNVTAEGFEKQIAITSFNIKRRISMVPGSIANRESSNPKFSELVLTKGYDVTTPALFKESVSTSVGKKVILHFVRTNNNTLQEFMTYELSDCLVSGFNIYADGGRGGVPREEIKLSYSMLTVSHTQFDKSNSVGVPERQGYNLITAKLI